MVKCFDAIVIGVGGFGSAAVAHLARRGATVLGLEQFDIAHDRGSSHGETRVIRQAYFEHADYVPLLKRAYTLWDELQEECGKSIFTRCGLLMVGTPTGDCISGALHAAALHGIEVDKISPRDAASRFPGFYIPDDCTTLFEPNAGFLNVEECVRAHVDFATKKGATVRTNERVLNWASDGSKVRVTTVKETYEAGRLVIAAGAWASHLMAGLGLPLTVLRKALFWVPAKNNTYDVSNGGPTFFYELPEGCFYGFPSIDGQSMKVAEHTGGLTVDDPSDVVRGLVEDDTTRFTPFVSKHLIDTEAQPLRHSTCMYTMTPDQHFIVDRHPEHENVVFGAGFSGHGFKFTSSIGEVLAQMALEQHSELNMEFLKIDRDSLR